MAWSHGPESAAADRVGDEAAGSDTASSEDAAGGLETRKRELRILGMYDPQEAEHSADVGQVFHATVAEPEGDQETSDRVRELTESCHSGNDVKQIIAELNPLLRGWSNYFRTGNADREFTKMDGYVYWRLYRWQMRRGGQRAIRQKAWTGDQLQRLGLYRLRGKVRYPAQATSRRSLLSRVRETARTV